MTIKLGVMRTEPTAIIPEFQTDGAACFDLVAVNTTPSGSGFIYGTGLVFDIPSGYHIKLYSRSGHGFKHGLRLCNSTGIIDADYRGELKVKLVCDEENAVWPQPGERIAQAMLVKNVDTLLVEIDDVTETQRGDQGFGSTGQ